nr:phospholipase-like protein [Tanacetum cinerariifolium]
IVAVFDGLEVVLLRSNDWTENCILIHFMLGQQLEVEDDGNENVHLYYCITDNITIQFGREEFFWVTGLRFEVENLGDNNDSKLPIPFRRRVFLSCFDGEHITSNMVFRIIDDEFFDRLHDDDAVSLCCLGILQLVLLGVKGKRRIPDWILRLANDTVGWDNYPCGSYVWPTLYSQLKNANVRRWPKLYATQPTTEIDKKSYSIFGYTWAFKENLPAARLTPDETEARSDWWISSRAYFDGGIGQAERVPRHLNFQNMYEVPSELYRQFEEQKIDLEKQKREIEEIKKTK